ncbi:MAG: hypothetical protein QXO33_07400 [Nitrososphaeria archaeon]
MRLNVLGLKKCHKIIKLGKVGLGLFLPKIWWSNFNLRPGQKVIITIHENGSLTIIPINDGSQDFHQNVGEESPERAQSREV